MFLYYKSNGRKKKCKKFVLRCVFERRRYLYFLTFFSSYEFSNFSVFNYFFPCMYRLPVQQFYNVLYLNNSTPSILMFYTNGNFYFNSIHADPLLFLIPRYFRTKRVSIVSIMSSINFQQLELVI